MRSSGSGSINCLLDDFTSHPDSKGQIQDDTRPSSDLWHCCNWRYLQLWRQVMFDVIPIHNLTESSFNLVVDNILLEQLECFRRQSGLVGSPFNSSFNGFTAPVLSTVNRHTLHRVFVQRRSKSMCTGNILRLH